MNIVPLEDFEERPNLNGEKYFLVKNEIKLDEIETFLEKITDEQMLSFHDQFYPTHPDDDPGAYVCIEREGDDFKYSYGNHHWSSKTSYQSGKFLAAYILINANNERFDGQPFTLKMWKFPRKKTTVTESKEENIEKETFLSRLLAVFTK